MKTKQLILVFCVFVVAVSLAYGRTTRGGSRSLVELAPKASLYIGDDTDFGIGLEGIFNPSSGFGVRLDLAEIRFDNTAFYLNYYQSLDALFYYPMGGMDTYFSAGFGLISIDTGSGSWNFYTIRGGLGFNHRMGRGYDLFVEPGLIITGNGSSDVILRISGGLKFGIVR